MHTDIIRYRLAKGVTQNALLEAAKNVFDSWMKHQPGFISWQINAVHDGDFMDIVVWQSKEAADAANVSMQRDVPMDTPWFACYDMATIVTEKATELGAFTP